MGYQYAHHISGKYSPRKQWLIHLLVLGLPLGAFALAVLFGVRHSPIAVAESLAPTGEASSPILSVLLLLTVAIGVPFFVVSTSAPLLQKWFTCTGHPSARDPYFLYSASNFGSMISLLGYPLFIEPHLSIVGQAWVFAIGFAVLAVLIGLCGYAAANPIGVVPGPGSQYKDPRPNGQNANAYKPAPAVMPEPPPTLARKAKWVTLAFVPSSLMLGVTFYMTTDIASIPLLWVLPLALYLITFIIAFARLPDWFRIVIGNMAPVLILLLVFVLLTNVTGRWIGLTLALHLVTFFAAALMCHYELARDRPSTQYLTNFFLLMSVGGVLGGIFNALLAPLIFPHAYEYRLALVIACLMVPRLMDGSSSEEPEEDKKIKEKYLAGSEKTPTPAQKKADAASGPNAPPTPEEPKGRLSWMTTLLGNDPATKRQVALVLDLAFPVVMGTAFYFMLKLPQYGWYERLRDSIAENLTFSASMIQIMLLYAVPIMVCFFFVDRPLRFALCVAAILGPPTYREEGGDSDYSERSFFGILKVQKQIADQRPYLAVVDGRGIPAGKVEFHRLVHGTTLHGIQIYNLENNALDMFQCLTALNPWENLAVAGACHRFNAREEPLTYYHRSGPVGAMFHELRTRKGGADAKERFAMVGLGTGSASCYALKGQKIDFYEIDAAVKKLVDETDQYFTYTSDARTRGADLKIEMGDARLKLKENTDRKYALLLVDAFSSDSIPVHLLTREAVQLYLDRMTDDGILALHISNKYVKLEPVVSAIARDLGLTARVWNDDSERGGPGKTASSWVVLARSPAHLGNLYTEIGDLPLPLQPDENGNEKVQYMVIRNERGGYEAKPFMECLLNECLYTEFTRDFRSPSADEKDDKFAEMNRAKDQSKVWLDWVNTKLDTATNPSEKERLAIYKKLLERYGPQAKFHDVLMTEYGHAFRQLEYYKEVHAWTDDYSDVMRVMMMPELQKIRKFFGLPTPIER
jgi:hypothetical protein